MARRAENQDERFDKYFIPAGDIACWIWSGGKAHYGHGQFSLSGANGKTVKAHRYMWERINGAVPDGVIIRHKCDQPSCVNPAHLETGSHADNSADMVARGRHRAGHAARANAVRALTHCSNGHKYEGDSFRVLSTGTRRCKTCRLIWQREWRLKRNGDDPSSK